MRVSGVLRGLVAAALVPVMLVQQGFAWGRDGHRMINRLAVAALPRDVPEFLRSPAAQEAMEFYGPEPDNWKETAEPELKAVNDPDHFMDMEWANLVAGGTLPRKRYDFIRAMIETQKTRKDIDFTPENIGLLLYAADEGYERLKAAMRRYRSMIAAHGDTKASEAEVVFLAGILGHWIGDGSQPLHATMQYNGWTGPNPNGYATDKKFHARFESDYVKANVRPEKDVAPLIAKDPVVIADVFKEFVKYLNRSNSLVEESYRLDKSGAFAGAGTPEGKAFVDERLAAGATELRDIIYTAWVKSGDPLPPYRPAATTTPAGL